ncbi:MAG: hypothetical protein IPK60_09940 [Sandaracinaceae bacterium]|nr:hypothetical protein [Sandaracinaceae bacterium]
MKASNTATSDWFGAGVSLAGDGNTLAVGTRNEDSAATGVGGDQTSNAALDSGAAFVFVRSGSVWTQEAYIKASNTGADNNFGCSVALSGDGTTLAVGAEAEASNASTINGDQTNNASYAYGAAYVFTRSGSVWSQQAYVKPSTPVSGGYFGRRCALLRRKYVRHERVLEQPGLCVHPRRRRMVATSEDKRARNWCGQSWGLYSDVGEWRCHRGGCHRRR